MFQKARLKLTAWYLLIIMLISIIFSLVIYKETDNELKRIEERRQSRMEHFRGELINRPGFLEIFEPVPIDEIRKRLILTLIFINSGIFVAAGWAGYFLAGRTLRPIRIMLDEQTRFVADASHELRTPLTSLKSEIEVYLRSKNRNLKNAERLLTSNLEEVNTMQSLSDNLLELAHYQKSNGNFSAQSISLTEILNESLKKVSTLAKQKEVNIISKIKDSHVLGDRQKLIELFVILFDNAIKYSPEKSRILLSSKNIDNTASINISDRGMGIADKDLPHIFNRFFRVDQSRSKANVKGYGLGLSIAKHIVDMHNGKITVKSKVGRGTTVLVQLPKSKQE